MTVTSTPRTGISVPIVREPGCLCPVEPSDLHRILATRTGLRFPENLTYDGWERAGRQLSRLVDTSAWCLGDWLVYGQRRYADRYQRAVLAAGLDYQTLRNYAWVAGRFDWPRRRAELSFQHHAELASLPPAEQDRWLEQAVTGRWSRNQLRLAVRSRAAAAGASSRGELPRVQVPRKTVERWQRAADRSNTDLRGWVVETLNTAASQALDGAGTDDVTMVRG